jgi:hypothetical protein
MIDIPITPEMRDQAEKYKYLQGHHNPNTMNDPLRDTKGTLGEIIICQYLGLNVDEYFKMKVDMNWRWDFNLNIGKYDVKTMHRKRMPMSHWMHDVTGKQKVTNGADGYLFCDIRDPDHGMGWIVGSCTREFFNQYATYHEKGQPMVTNPNYTYEDNTWEILISLLTNPAEIKLKEETTIEAQHTANIEAKMKEKPVTPPEVIARFKRDYPALALRVRDGNDKLVNAWVQVQDYEDPKMFDASMEKISVAAKKLSQLCLYLGVIEEVLEGKADCLYMMNKKKTRKCKVFCKSKKGTEVETFCWVCPSNYPYWSEEWSAFNQAFQIK